MDKKQPDPVPEVGEKTSSARNAAEADISQDPETKTQPRIDELDEGELARVDNSND